ncbi:CsbD family protein [Aeromicrobium sp.]|nr:CsbD family protein [Candidatus Saccharibacteria bacterium]
MSSMSDKVSGKLNQAVGKATGNERVQAKGEAQEASGNFKDNVKNAGAAISNKIDDATGKHDK